jgi:hypothetical protein
MSNEEGTRSSSVAARVGIGIGIAIGIENKLESPILTSTSILRWNHPAMVESLWMTPCPVIRSRPGCSGAFLNQRPHRAVDYTSRWAVSI